MEATRKQSRIRSKTVSWTVCLILLRMVCRILFFTDCDRICVVACGTAMHAGLVAQALVKSIVHVQMDVELASEFMYSGSGHWWENIGDRSITVRWDNWYLGSIKICEETGRKMFIRYQRKRFFHCKRKWLCVIHPTGPEIAVASTKAYTTQLSVFYLVVAKMALLRGVYTEEQTKSFIAELERVRKWCRKYWRKDVTSMWSQRRFWKQRICLWSDVDWITLFYWKDHWNWKRFLIFTLRIMPPAN